MFPTVRGTPVVREGVGWWFVVQCGTGIIWTLCLYENTIPVNIVTILIMWISAVVLVGSVYRFR
jgi:hypothetical protein